jgi:hypothetical protein
MPKWLSDYTQGLIAKGNAVAAEPYQPYSGPRVAGFSPDQQNAFDLTRANVGTYLPGMDLANEYTNEAANSNPYETAQPYLSAAQGQTMQGANAPGGLQAAAPWLTAASSSFPDAVDQYMSPYKTNVIDYATTLANRNFNEQTLPTLTNMFTRNGTFGSTGHERTAMNAGRDLTEGVQKQALAALDQGYMDAGNLYGADMSRYAGLAGTAGGLQNQDVQNKLQAGQALGTLGQTAGTLRGQQGQLQLQAGQQQGTLAQMMQQLGIRDAASLEAVGSEYQGLGQKNLDLAYQDFQNQRDYPKDQLSFMSELIRGLPTPSSETTTNVGPSSVGYQPSPLAQLASLGSLGAATQAGGSARGGRIRYRYSKGGSVKPRGGALSAMVA